MEWWSLHYFILPLLFYSLFLLSFSKYNLFQFRKREAVHKHKFYKYILKLHFHFKWWLRNYSVRIPFLRLFVSETLCLLQRTDRSIRGLMPRHHGVSVCVHRPLIPASPIILYRGDAPRRTRIAHDRTHPSDSSWKKLKGAFDRLWEPIIRK